MAHTLNSACKIGAQPRPRQPGPGLDAGAERPARPPNIPPHHDYLISVNTMLIDSRRFPLSPRFSCELAGRLSPCPVLSDRPGTCSGHPPRRPAGSPTRPGPRSPRRPGGCLRENLVAWCIVPFDSKKRAPEERAAMLERLGFRHFAYDWRAEHIPTFDAEIDALKRHGIRSMRSGSRPASSTANRGSSSSCSNAAARRPSSGCCWTWVPIAVKGPSKSGGSTRPRRSSVRSPKRPARSAARWPLQPRRLVRRAGKPDRDHRASARSKAITNVGMVYNLHHGHDHLDRFAALLAKISPTCDAST